MRETRLEELLGRNTHLEFSQHPISVRKRRKVVKPIAVGYVKVNDQQ